MAMMISKFRRLIQSRVVWLTILGVVVFSFVVWGVQLPERREHDQPPGRLYGRPVPAAEFRQAYVFELLGHTLRTGNDLQRDDAMDAELRRAAWHRLMALREADRMGLHAYDEEVVRTIRSVQIFHRNGAFDPEQYRAFVREFLTRRFGMNERGFEEYLREELRIERLHDAFRQTVVVTPAERDAHLAELTTQMTVAFVEIDNAAVENEVEVGEDEARRHFAADPEAFRVPPQVRARMVFFDAARHIEDIAPFADEDIEDYYLEHRARFRRLVFEPGAEGEPAAPRWVDPPLEDVREQVLVRMRQRAAIARARERADDFLRLIAPYFTATPIGFDEAAERLDLDVRTTEPFARGERVPGTTIPARTSELVYDLQPTGGEYFTDPILGEDGVYVFALEERIPARIPAFEEVADRALADARRTRLAEARRTRAEALRRRVLVDGASFADAAEAEGLRVREAGPFDLMEGLPGQRHGAALAQAAAVLNPGEIGEPIPAAGNVILLPFLVAREPGSPEAAGDMAEALVDFLARQRTQRLVEGWIEQRLRDAGFTERTPPSDAANRDG